MSDVAAALAAVPFLNRDGHACEDTSPVTSCTRPHNGPLTSRHASGATCVGRQPEVPEHLRDLAQRVRLAPASIDVDNDGWTVRVEWEPIDGLDRLDAHAWSTGIGRKGAGLAARLKRALDAGAVVTPGEVYCDVARRVGVHSRSAILGRTMNADLRRLGY